jgi:hypothetical protein
MGIAPFLLNSALFNDSGHAHVFIILVNYIELENTHNSM